MTEGTIQDWLDRVPEHFVPERAVGVSGDIQLNLTGEQGGNWFITIQNQQVEVTKGVSPNPRVSLQADSQDVLKVLTGQMDGMRAFMQGKLRVTGDTSFAMKMTNLFRP
jgi:putative sterol carrier protein